MNSLTLNIPLTLSLDIIEYLRQNIINNISVLNINKQKILPNEFNTLINYHKYNLNILDNMKAVKLVSLKNPINDGVFELSRQESNPNYNYLKDVYKPPQITDLWKQQFDTQVINPECNTLPPSNVWALRRPFKDPNFL